MVHLALTGILAHISPPEKAFDGFAVPYFNAMWIQPIFSFTELVTCNLKGFMFLETVTFQKGILKNLTGKHLCLSLFFNKVPDLRPATLLTKRRWHGCFPVNFVKLLI